MLDPFFGSLALSLAPDAIKAVVSMAWNAHHERAAADKAREAEIDEAYGLALRLLASLLHETRANINRMRFMAETFHTPPPPGAPPNQRGITLGMFDFTIADAMMPDLCRVVPSPELLEACRRLVSAAKRVDFYQRAAGASIGSGNASLFMLAVGFADDAINKGVIENFNAVVAVGDRMAGAVFANDPNAKIANLLPRPIDPSKPVEHDAI